MVVRRSAWVAVSLLIGAATAGCTFEVYRTIDAVAVERSSMDLLEQQVGQRPDAIDCPDDLKAEVGQSIRCVPPRAPTGSGSSSP